MTAGKPAAEWSREFLAQAHYAMRFVRAFDDRMIVLYKQGKIVGGCLSQLGHEAISVGSAMALGPDDVIAPMHRDLGAYFVRGMEPGRMMAQYLARAAGVSGGRDSGLHGCGDLSKAIIGYVSNLPDSLPVTAGVAMAIKLKGEPRVAMTYFGDGSSSHGLTHETLNWSAVFWLPIVFICENNQFAYSTPLTRQMRIENIADRAAAYGFPGIVIDGNDFFSVFATVKEAVERARAGGGPTLIECKTFRMRGHAIHDNQFYVPKELLARWAAPDRDPILRFETYLRDHGLLDDTRLAELQARIEAEIDEAVAYAERCPYPDPATVGDGVYASEDTARIPPLGKRNL